MTDTQNPATSAVVLDDERRPAKSHCQNGGDVCLAGNRDGICCPEESCDIDDGVRAASPQAAVKDDERAAFDSANAIDAEIHRLLEMKIERFPKYAKSLLEGYATKVEVFDHMIKVAQAAGFESLTEAISVAKKARAASQRPMEQIGKSALVLTGAQLLEALDFIAPDRATDAEQLESEVAIEYGDGHAGKAMYCWCAEYPEEGSWVLDGTSATVAQPVEQTRALMEAQRDAERWRYCVEICHQLSDSRGEFVCVELPRLEGDFRSTDEMFITTVDAALTAARPASGDKA
jgi:hypothetical protein